MSQDDFHSAIQQIRESLEEAASDAEVSQQLATALIGAYGTEDGKAREALAVAAGSTRFPRSAEGARAMSYAQLYGLTQRGRWLNELRSLAAQHKSDALVQSSLAGACLEGSDWLLSHEAEAGQEADAQALVREALEHARLCEELAVNDAQKQVAQLLFARAAMHAPEGGSADKAQALWRLGKALGAPDIPGSVESQRVPEYELFLLDKHVQLWREKDEGFDGEVARLVSEYLTRRKALFSDIFQPKPNKPGNEA
jgi:hypothetical protein